METELVAAQISDWDEGKFSSPSSCRAYFWAMRKLKEEEISVICAFLLLILLLPLILMMLYELKTIWWQSQSGSPYC